jgi:hypothetical protein
MSLRWSGPSEPNRSSPLTKPGAGRLFQLMIKPLPVFWPRGWLELLM